MKFPLRWLKLRGVSPCPLPNRSATINNDLYLGGATASGLRLQDAGPVRRRE